MNTAASLLQELEALDIKLNVEDGKLRFSAPKGALTDELRARLAQEKQNLIALLEQRQNEAWDEKPIPIQPRGRGLPLSTGQQRFWFLDRLDRGNSAAFVMPPIELHISGNLNVAALQYALQGVVERHEVLHSAFAIENDQPVQVPLSGVRVACPLQDLSALDAATQQQQLKQIVRDEALTPFDLAQGALLLRARLLKLADNEHVFILTMHHIIGDGWSMGILIDELSQLYRGAAAGKPVALPALPIQYADYASWERERLTGEHLARQQRYWLNTLADAPSFLELPTDHPRPRVRSNHGSAVHFQFAPELSTHLNALCSQTGVTPFMALLAAFGVLLCRYSDKEDLVIGSPIAVRPHSQTEGLIGLFLNTLALRIDLSGNPDFKQLLQRVRKTALAAFEHAEMPFDRLLQELDLERTLNHTPLFQVLFALQNAPMGEVALEGVKITPQPTESLHSPFDLVMSLEETTDGLKGFLRYNLDLYERATVERMTQHFQLLVQGLLTAPTTPIRHQTMLSATELSDIRRWRGGWEGFATDSTLHRTFEQQVATHTERIALRFEDSTLNYRELDQRANQVAQRLRRMGVTRGSRVGLCVTRSLELVIGLVGILKAGGAYVPLDPAYPEDRLSFMAEDSGLDVVVVYQATPPLKTQQLDLSDASLAAESGDAPDNVNQPEDVAYVIYTSGSTGRPKGVEVTHANVLRLFTCTEKLFGFDHTDVWSLFHSYAFDFSVWELWGALLYGGQVVVVPYAISRSPDQFHALLQQSGVTVLNQTPSAFRQLIEADQRQPASTALKLKWVVFGGEALDPRSLSRWVERYGLDAPQLINMYGITETTVHVSYHRVTPADIAAAGSVVGHPLPDLSVDLLDRYGQPVPIGVGGEIIVGGAGVARGYLNRPELTAERFVMMDEPDADRQTRRYRSGDLARWRADGLLDYIGRIDLQVKIRGFRIELGEIETALASHPEVAEAFVDARQEAEGARLIAYVSPRQYPNAPLAVGLRQHLKARLPDYMVPAVIRVLERLPLTTNGKLDRRALAKLDAEASQHVDAPISAPPQTPIEILLADIWREVLAVPQLGLDDNFFELGGDSIRGAILVNKVQEKLGSVVYVVALFEASTLRQFIDYLRHHYPDAMARLGDAEAGGSGEGLMRVAEGDIESFRALIPAMPPLSPLPPGGGGAGERGNVGDAAPPSPQPLSHEGRGALATVAVPPAPTFKPRKNPRMIFVLSPPRSGSTLLRVLLGGHPQLFSPPELELLGFETLGQRRDICSGRDAFWVEGALRAVMEARHVDADEARRLMAQREDRDMPVSEFYGELQSWLDGKILVDKSPSYTLDVGVMRRAEEYFEEPLYLHLHRHPYGMISSFEEAKLDQIFFRYPHSYSTRRLAELIWVQSHRNVFEFLRDIPAERQMAISFEDMTRQPEASARRLCDFLGIAFTQEMLDIHGASRMTDGIHRESRMLGDVKFHTHKSIDASVADRWRERYGEDFIGDPSWAMAATLGYSIDIKPGAANTAIEVQERTGRLPLSFAQQRLWFLDQLEGAGTAYNMPVALRLRGELDRDALVKSLAEIGQRHEGLRSRFVTVDGEPAVEIAAQLPPTAIIDLSHLDAAAQQAAVDRELRADAAATFDLANGPLFTSRLLILGAQHHVALINMHHIVSDGWSMGVLVSEWSQLYNAYAANQPSPLAPLPVQYLDYAFWQRRYLGGGALERQLSYWRQQLAGIPALLELPTDRPRPALQRFDGATLAVSLAADLHIALKRLADRSGVSLYMLTLAAFAVLLARYSGQRDIVLGSPSANRSRREIEGLIGFFVNTLVLRLPLGDKENSIAFDAYLAQVRQTALQAYAHQDVSFEQLVEDLKPQRNLSYSPLFQVMFSLQSNPAVLPELSGLAVEEISLRQVVAKYDLTLSLTEYADKLDAAFEYNSDLFDADSIARFARHYQNLLRAIVAAPSTAVDRLPLLAADEIELIGAQWNATQLELTPPLTIHGLFEAQVARTPDAIAVQFRDQQLSYRELNRRAEACAARLRVAGLRPGALAALSIERSAEMLIGLLAILKCDCAYVPLDPNYPADRVRYVLEDAGVSLLLTQTSLLPYLPDIGCARVLIDTDEIKLGAGETDANKADAHGLAYVIYTSGSTGKPKGVMIGHRAAVNFLRTMRDAPGISASDTLLAVTTISFDIAVLELYLPLSVGARIIIADELMCRDAEALAQTIAAQNVSLMQATPATWRMLLAIAWPGSPQLTILCGGEALPTSLATPLLPRCKALWNMYGPTETTVWSTVQRVTEADLERASVPIGRPIGNTTIYILDAARQIQPIGVAGDLFIGGEGLAHGYRHRPDLTAERFIADPFIAGQKIYCTGDIARYLADGRIEYLGRGDQQIKIRGFRVELGEIEHILAQQADIDVCAVILDTQDEQNARLVAFYVDNAPEDSGDRSAELRRALLAALPDYMAPSLYVRLAAMPLTPNGKIDRLALRAPADAERHSAAPSQGFRDAIEHALLRIWEEVLDVRPIGIRDNFFELGGHSIVAVRLMAKVAQQFGRQLPLASLFQGATVEAMARLLRADDGAANALTWSSLVTIQPQGEATPFYCAAGAGGNVVYFNDLARAMGKHRPFVGLQPPGLDGVTPVHSAVETLAAHYLATIRREHGAPPRLLSGHSFGGLVAFEMARQLHELGEDAALLLLLDTPAPHFFQPSGTDWSEAHWLTQVSAIASHLYGADVSVPLAELQALPEAEQLPTVHARLIQGGVLPEGSALSFFKGFVEVYKANLRVKYAPQKLGGTTRVVLLRSLEEQPEQISSEQYATIRATPALGWLGYIDGGVEIVDVPGDHLTMLRAPGVEALAGSLNRWMEGA